MLDHLKSICQNSKFLYEETVQKNPILLKMGNYYIADIAMDYTNQIETFIKEVETIDEIDTLQLEYLIHQLNSIDTNNTALKPIKHQIESLKEFFESILDNINNLKS